MVLAVLSPFPIVIGMKGVARASRGGGCCPPHGGNRRLVRRTPSEEHSSGRGLLGFSFWARHPRFDRGCQAFATRFFCEEQKRAQTIGSILRATAGCGAGYS